MIRLAIFDNNPSSCNSIKQSIVKYSVQDNVDFDLLSFFENTNQCKIEKYASSINIALISLDLQDGKSIGKQIYSLNEDCRIIYYSSDNCELAPLLCVRPCGFYKTEKCDVNLINHIKHSVSDLKISKNHFFYETRKDVFIIPMKSIMYFQSDLKYVMIHTDKYVEQIYGKLSAIEPDLSSDFLRIHKSYIVNIRYIKKIDKSQKVVILLNDKMLPISDVNYKTVVARLLERKNENEL